MIKRILFFYSLLFIAVHSVPAQDSIPLIHSGAVIHEASLLHDEGKYEEAISKYLSIPESDTNYLAVIPELINSYTASGQNEKALSLGEKARDLESPYRANILMGIGNALDNLGKSREAVKTYLDAIKQFPFVQLLYYNLGVTYFKLADYNHAMDCFCKSLKLNPFHPGSHLYLGKCMILEGSRTKAILSLETYLILKPSDNKTLVLLENLVNDAVDDEGSIEPVTRNNDFREMDLILKSKAALDHRFQTNILLEASITRQTELLFDLLPGGNGNDDFWMKFYLPLFEKIKQQDLVEPFIYTWLSSVSNEKVKEWNKNHEALLKRFYSTAHEQMSSWRNRGTVTLPDGSTVEKTFWYYDSGELNYIGNVDEGRKPVGYWIAFYKNGHKQAEGFFNAENNKDGTWKYFYDNGVLQSLETDSNGVLTDTLKIFHENGTVKGLLPYNRNGLRNGTVQYFFNCGDIRETTPYRNGLREGTSRLYYAGNKPAAEMHYVHDTLDGPYRTYYTPGNKHEIYKYTNGKIEGTYLEYYSTGMLKEKGNYAEGKKEGAWTGFYEDGSKEYEGKLTSGKRKGDWITYYRNGRRESVIHYVNGTIHGYYETFDRDGVLHHIQIYENDTLKGQKFFNKTGNILSKAYNPGGDFTIQAFFPDGTPEYTATYRQGLLEGKIVSLYHSGKTKTIQNFKKGRKNGLLEAYYETGDLQFRVNYKEGNEHGYYRSYYKNGRINEEGWFQDGKKQQQWLIYDKLGNLSENNYFINDQIHGIHIQYAPHNKPFLMYRYHFGDVVESVQYDSAGRMFNRIKYDCGNGTMRVLYHDQRLMQKTGVECGLLEDHSETYYPDGLVKLVSTPPDSTGLISITARYPSGKLKVTGALLNGERFGEWTWYYENGNIDTRGQYKNGEAVGIWTDYYENGNINIRRHYQRDELNGSFSFYDQFGQLIYEKTYLNGRPVTFRYMTGENTWSEPVTIGDGILKSYFSNGNISAIEEYSGGFFNGERKIYYSNGQLYKKTFHRNGSGQKEFITWYPSGQIKTRTHYLDDEIHGKWTSYYKNGQIHEQKAYYLSKLHGPSIRYNQKGKVVSEIYYWNDELY